MLFQLLHIVHENLEETQFTEKVLPARHYFTIFLGECHLARDFIFQVPIDIFQSFEQSRYSVNPFEP